MRIKKNVTARNVSHSNTHSQTLKVNITLHVNNGEKYLRWRFYAQQSLILCRVETVSLWIVFDKYSHYR